MRRINPVTHNPKYYVTQDEVLAGGIRTHGIGSDVIQQTELSTGDTNTVPSGMTLKVISIIKSKFNPLIPLIVGGYAVWFEVGGVSIMDDPNYSYSQITVPPAKQLTTIELKTLSETIIYITKVVNNSGGAVDITFFDQTTFIQGVGGGAVTIERRYSVI